ncbi:MAG: hypothetical protein C4532_17115 [Candidatus Abyssobacteria bacterium SURF_17]|uniref:Uncharacterized protein n=1 Tax=Candidatus Abyssobacteria bacterium SURF_17 TaxID=2093361 RepID=A0A419ERI2_9BACT|nr:MAG: hypothetical protein C4532_17115 [Candidatus Abyssubacteria bacterium SURF_17]
MSKIEDDIRKAVKAGKLKQPFRAADVRKACPQWPLKTLRTFLPKHRVKNPGGYREIFVRVFPGRYKLK